MLFSQKHLKTAYFLLSNILEPIRQKNTRTKKQDNFHEKDMSFCSYVLSSSRCKRIFCDRQSCRKGISTHRRNSLLCGGDAFCPCGDGRSHSNVLRACNPCTRCILRFYGIRHIPNNPSCTYNPCRCSLCNSILFCPFCLFCPCCFPVRHKRKRTLRLEAPRNSIRTFSSVFFFR